MIFIMALIMCTLPLLVFEMISVLNGFAKAGKIQLLRLLVKGKETPSLCDIPPFENTQ